MRNSPYNVLTIFLLIALFLVSCEIINPEEDIPTYIKVSGVSVTTDFEEEGTARHDIHDVWIRHAGKNLGAYNIPFEVPILQQDGKSEIQFDAGIKTSGTSTIRDKYPFYEPIIVNSEFKPNATDSFGPRDLVFEYKDNVKFLWMEAFEQQTISLQPIENNGKYNNYDRTRNSELVFEGKASMQSILDSDNPVMGIQSFPTFSRQDIRLGSPSYLEIHYKNDVTIQVGYVYQSAEGFISIQTPFLFISPSTEWKKIYIELTNELNRMKEGDAVKIYFAGALPSGVDRAEIFLDNIKLVTFE